MHMAILGITKKALTNAVKELGFDTSAIHLQHSSVLGHGDISTNIAMVLGKETKQNPKDIAGEIITYIKKHKLPEIEKIELAGSGFINFFLSRDFFAQSIKEIINAGEDWGKNNSQQGLKIMVEYTNPNPFKEFHIGHLMSNTIGESIARLVEFSGAEVKRANYYGDVGLHVAKAIWGKQQKTEFSWGAAYAYGATNYDTHKNEIDELNKKIYDKSDPTINALYEQGRKESIEAFEILYKKLGTAFDFNFPESDVWKKGKDIVEKHKNVFEESDGAIVFRGEKFDKTFHTRVFITSQGLPTYETKELGLFGLKLEKGNLDISITITANEQKEYFKIVLKAAEQINELMGLAKKTTHIAHGMMRLPSGKMSSRTGDVVAAEDLINDVKNAVLSIQSDREIPDKDKTAEIIAIGALKYSILKQATGKDIIYDVKKSTSFEGDSGPYLQYAHTRAESVLKKVKSQKSKVKNVPPHVHEIERLLYRFQEVVERAQQEYEPHHIATYLIEIAGAFNNFYAKEKIIGGEYEEYYLALTKAFEITMRNGLYLLGIEVPEHM